MTRRRLIVWGALGAVALFSAYVALVVVIAGGGSDSRSPSADTEGPAGASTTQQGAPGETTRPPVAEGGRESRGSSEPEVDSAIEENKKKGIEKTYVTPPPPPSQEGVGNREGGGEGSGEKLTGRQDERVRAAAGEFIAAAYGSSTDSEDDYYREVYQSTASRKVAGSPGYSQIKKLGEAAGDGGLSSAAVLEGFSIERAAEDGEQVEGVADFTVGEGYSRYGDIEGKTKGYTQRLRLVERDGAAYKVEWIGELEEKGGPR